MIGISRYLAISDCQLCKARPYQHSQWHQCNVSHILDFGAAIRVAPDDWRVGTSPSSSNLRASNRWAASRVCTIRVRTERDLPIPISSARRPPRHSFTRRFSLAFVNLCLYLFRVSQCLYTNPCQSEKPTGVPCAPSLLAREYAGCS
jgi:hypothetical protein